MGPALEVSTNLAKTISGGKRRVELVTIVAESARRAGERVLRAGKETSVASNTTAQLARGKATRLTVGPIEVTTVAPKLAAAAKSTIASKFRVGGIKTILEAGVGVEVRFWDRIDVTRSCAGIGVVNGNRG